jgi:RND superfamily putative drug exporter
VLATSGRTVFFSSLTVSAALASLLVFPQRFLYSMGLGGALVALFAALISLTVLPAVLTLLGSRVNPAPLASCSAAPTPTRSRTRVASGTGSRDS